MCVCKRKIKIKKKKKKIQAQQEAQPDKKLATHTSYQIIPPTKNKTDPIIPITKKKKKKNFKAQQPATQVEQKQAQRPVASGSLIQIRSTPQKNALAESNKKETLYLSDSVFSSESSDVIG